MAAEPNIPPLLRGFLAAMRPKDRRPAWQWCEEHIVVDDTSPKPGPWRADYSPWVKPVMEAATDPVVRRVAVKCAAQSAKTQTIINLVNYICAEDPGPALYVMAAKDEARDFMRDRVLPTFQNCRPVADLLQSVQGMTAVFSGMSCYFAGSHSKSKLQSKPIRWLFLDEIRNYPNGALELALKRTRSFWNAKEFLISTADKVGDAVESEYRAGTQETWNICCPKCAAWQPLLFDGLTWDKEEEAKPAAEYSFDRLAETIRLKCSTDGCGHTWKDAPTERRRIAREGKFIAKNPNAPRHRRSFHWNAMLPQWVSWRSIVEEYLGALRAAKSENPDLEPLKTFWNETLGESWDEALGVIDDYGFLEERKGDYGFGEVWAEEVCRFMAADKQAEGGEHYWWAIRAFASGLRSRLIAYGRAETTEQLEEIRSRYSVPLKNAMIDSGFRASEVYRWCQRSGWKAFKGDSTDLYTTSAKNPETGKEQTVRRIWHKVQVDPMFGVQRNARLRAVRSKPIWLYRFAGDTTTDYLAEFMRGIVGDWTIPKAVGRDYMAQITAERRVEVVNSRGGSHYTWHRHRKANHLLDCERMILVAAVITGVVQSGTIRAPRLKPAA
jgi:phage terminase large subunit GpA-like protein